MNPYWGSGFFSFFATLFKRVLGGAGALASDEVQLVLLILLSVTSAWLGCFLILKRKTMLANALSHTLLIGIACAFLVSAGHDLYHLPLTALMIGAGVSSLLTVGFVHLLKKHTKLPLSASIGMVFSLMFALGITIVSLYLKSSHIGIEAIMGNLDAIHSDDLMPVGIVCGIVGLFTLVGYPFLKVVAFDSGFARSIGVRVQWIELMLLFSLAMLSTIAFRAIGVFLFLALLTAPPLCALRIHRSLGKVFMTSTIIAVICSVMSVAISRAVFSVWHLPVSTAGVMVVLLGLTYFVFSFDSVGRVRVPYGHRYD